MGVYRGAHASNGTPGVGGNLERVKHAIAGGKVLGKGGVMIWCVTPRGYCMAAACSLFPSLSLASNVES